MITGYESWTEDGVVYIRNTNGDFIASNDADELINYLRYKGSGIKIAYDLDTFLAPIFRILPKDILERLSRFDSNLKYPNKAKKNDPTELFYLSERMFRAGRSHFYGLREWLDRPERGAWTLEETTERAEEILATLYRLGMKRPNDQPIRKLTSPIAVFEDSEWGYEFTKSLPTIYDLPDKALEMVEFASKADGREWVAAHQVGTFRAGEIHDYDRSSAYGLEASLLPDTRDMDYWKSDNLGSREMSATLGIVHGAFTLNTDHPYAFTSPIMTKREGTDLPRLPLGRLDPDYYTLDEVRWVQETGIGTFKLISGWFGEPKQDMEVRYPFKDIMHKLHAMRELSPIAARICKSLAVQIVGKLTETRATGELGKLRNDVLHAIVVARNRIAVSRFLVDNKVKENQIVCVQTDGVKLTVDLPCSVNGLGSWINKGSDDTLVVSPFKVYAKSNRPSEFAIADLQKLVAEHPNSQRYSKTNTHRITLIQALRNYNDITRVGELVQAPTSLDLVSLETEQNRVYSKLPRTGHQLLHNQYPSRPFII